MSAAGALGEDARRVPALCEALRGRGLAPLKGVAAMSWERVLTREGVPVEQHPTELPGGSPFERVGVERWAPAWAERLMVLEPAHRHDWEQARAVRAVVSRVAADGDLQRALLAEAALGGTGLAWALLHEEAEKSW